MAGIVITANAAPGVLVCACQRDGGIVVFTFPDLALVVVAAHHTFIAARTAYFGVCEIEAVNATALQITEKAYGIFIGRTFHVCNRVISAIEEAFERMV